ncbi:MAG: polymerase III subunit beta protein [Parcubacteria group bacterium GW2011_GWC1_43_12]|nr:MAG: polymerase III subunit beta protein [Parcubacteria group bacterium GW2011_GWB1_42_6]KKS91747.1 MAG: polymerase III subunit beta protein [Parcubacteria group bacterium GW2011_GWC1_43_12]
MKIICLQENLKTNLNIAQNIIGKNLTLPILNNLLLKTENGRLRISSTNLEIGINTWTNGKIEREGEITCPAKILYNFINNLPNKKIELESKNDSLVIKCENYKANIKCLSADDFPIIPKIKNEPLFELDGGVLKNALSQVAGSAAVSESRPEIAGILFSLDRNNLKLVATDSFRLAEKNISDINNKNQEQFSVIIPQRTAQEIIRIISEKNSSVKFITGNNQVLFDFGDAQLISRVIDGVYPDYQQIIPKEFKTSALVSKEDLLNTVRIAGIFSSKINNVKFSVLPDRLEIFSQDSELGENKSVVESQVKGKDMEVCFNYRYVLDGLNNIDSKMIFFGFSSESTASVMRPSESNDYTYVVMPIKLA